MKPIAAADRRIADIHDSRVTPFVFPDDAALGDAILQLDDSQPLGIGFHIDHMPPGMTTRGHRHTRAEALLVRDGDLTDNDGTVFRNGDLVFCRDGSEQNSRTVGGCTLAVFVSGPEVQV